MKYDIFISYRRKDSSGRSNVPTARQFKLAFEAPPYNYKVFFDFSECTDNYFSDTILPAIRTCDFFVLVLTKDCLARCVNEGDWVRREIEEAIAYNKKIIPITPDRECETLTQQGLPNSLHKLVGLQITTIYTDHMFEAGVEFLVNNRLHLNLFQELRSECKAEEVEQANNARNNDLHEYVDLGLPSGTLWATCNVGASKPEDYGDYFAWGETQLKENYWEGTYKHCERDLCKLNKYCTESRYGCNGFTDNQILLQACDDAATTNWGFDWCIPTNIQWEELLQNIPYIWIKRNGVKGLLFKAYENSLFLPLAGFHTVKYVNDCGDYWSSSLNMYCPSGAWAIYFDSEINGNYRIYPASRCGGRSVRPVRSVK